MSSTSGEHHVQEEIRPQQQVSQQGLVAKKVSWHKLRRYEFLAIMAMPLRLKRAPRIKTKLEKSRFAKYSLLLAVYMLGTFMVIGDGVLTPCISVLSAVGGIKEAKPDMSQDMIVWISVGILVCLFTVQRFGTDKVGYSFAPIICVWFAMIAGIGVYNFFKFHTYVIKALNPKYIVDYFKKNKKDAWIFLGGVVLAITGENEVIAIEESGIGKNFLINYAYSF